MLLLTRKRDQTIELTDVRTGEVLARVTVQDVKGAYVTLGFEAPRHIRIMRDDAIKREPPLHAKENPA